MTTTKIQVKITQWDDDRTVTRSGSFDSMATLYDHIQNFVGISNVISVEFTDNLLV